MRTVIFTDRTDTTIDRIACAVGFSGRNVRIVVTESMSLEGTYWNGGRKSEYFGFNLATMQSKEVPNYNPPQFGGPAITPTVDLVDGLCIARLEYTNGENRTLSLYIGPTSAAPLLPKPSELTEDERKVLVCTRSFKSSYAGIKDYRFAQSGMTRERWDAAKASCQAKGLLDKRGAITNEGKNAVPR
jgi:hypothetical protein